MLSEATISQDLHSRQCRRRWHIVKQGSSPLNTWAEGVSWALWQERLVTCTWQQQQTSCRSLHSIFTSVQAPTKHSYFRIFSNKSGMHCALPQFFPVRPAAFVGLDSTGRKPELVDRLMDFAVRGTTSKAEEPVKKAGAVLGALGCKGMFGRNH